MNMQMILTIAGLALIIVGIIGGGLQIKEITVPQISKVSRIAAIIFGLIIVTVAIVLNNGGAPAENPAPMESSAPVENPVPVENPAPIESSAPVENPATESNPVSDTPPEGNAVENVPEENPANLK